MRSIDVECSSRTIITGSRCSGEQLVADSRADEVRRIPTEDMLVITRSLPPLHLTKCTFTERPKTAPPLELGQGEGAVFPPARKQNKRTATRAAARTSGFLEMILTQQGRVRHLQALAIPRFGISPSLGLRGAPLVAPEECHGCQRPQTNNI
jgi:hypothetical protein